MSPRAVLSVTFVILLSASLIQIEPIPAAATESLLVIPETQPYEHLFPGEGYTFIASCNPENGTPDDPTDDIECSPKDILEYSGHGMPYLYSEAVEGNHDHAWWVAGDREGYRCAYGFMYDKHPDPFGDTFDPPRPGHFIARVTVVAPPEAETYGGIVDENMDEGQRWYDGSVYDGEGASEIIEEDCQATSLDPDFDYNAYVPKGPELIRVGLFRADGEISDIRDFTGLEGHFEFVSVEDFGGPNGPGGATVRVTLVRIEPDVQKVSHVIYYDTMNDGRAAVEINGFLDIADSTFVADIAWLAAEGITKGCNPPDNNLFCPDDSVTRGQMAAFLTRALDLPDASKDHFTDDESSTFENDINALAEAGITLGCNPPDNNHFCPNDVVTRGQMAAFLTRALDLPDASKDHFTDDESSTFEDDINALAEAGITLGCNPPDNDLFCPNDDVTRGQMAAFLHRAFAFFAP